MIPANALTLPEARRLGRLMDFADAEPGMVRTERFEALLAAMARCGPPARRRRRYACRESAILLPLARVERKVSG